MDLNELVHPPKDLYVQVRCREDYGEIATESGTVRLERNSQHFLLRTDVEGLIRQGILEHIE